MTILGVFCSNSGDDFRAHVEMASIAIMSNSIITSNLCSNKLITACYKFHLTRAALMLFDATPCGSLAGDSRRHHEGCSSHSATARLDRVTDGIPTSSSHTHRATTRYTADHERRHLQVLFTLCFREAPKFKLELLG